MKTILALVVLFVLGAVLVAAEESQNAPDMKSVREIPAAAPGNPNQRREGKFFGLGLWGGFGYGGYGYGGYPYGYGYGYPYGGYGYGGYPYGGYWG